ncbi:MAG: TolC family protein, partial [Sphingobacteriia bacterium]|nr:TolC family protein [Sphingobacteriia bacterium]
MISKYKFFLVLVAYFCISPLQQVFTQQAVYELNQLIDSAISNNYLLKVNEKNILVKQAEIEQLRTNYQPRIATSASFSYWKFLLPNKEKLLGGNTLTDMYTDITAYQTIYDWGDTKKRKEYAQAEIKLNDEVRRQIHNTIVYGVSASYLDVLMAIYEIDVLQNSIQQIESQLQYTRNLFQIGKVSNMDVLKTEVQLSVENKKLQKAQSDYSYQLIKLKNLCYLTDEQLPTIENTSNDLYKAYASYNFN